MYSMTKENIINSIFIIYSSLNDFNVEICHAHVKMSLGLFWLKKSRCKQYKSWILMQTFVKKIRTKYASQTKMHSRSWLLIRYLHHHTFLRLHLKSWSVAFLLWHTLRYGWWVSTDRSSTHISREIPKHRRSILTSLFSVVIEKSL